MSLSSPTDFKQVVRWTKEQIATPNTVNKWSLPTDKMPVPPAWVFRQWGSALILPKDGAFGHNVQKLCVSCMSPTPTSHTSQRCIHRSSVQVGRQMGARALTRCPTHGRQGPPARGLRQDWWQRLPALCRQWEETPCVPGTGALRRPASCGRGVAASRQECGTVGKETGSLWDLLLTLGQCLGPPSHCTVAATGGEWPSRPWAWHRGPRGHRRAVSDLLLQTLHFFYGARFPNLRDRERASLGWKRVRDTMN